MGVEEGHQRPGQLPPMAWVLGEPRSLAVMAEGGCRISMGRGRGATAGEGIRERGGLAGADGLFVKILKTPRSPLQPQAQLNPQSRTRGSGLPTEQGVPPASARHCWRQGGPLSATLCCLLGVHADETPLSLSLSRQDGRERTKVLGSFPRLHGAAPVCRSQGPPGWSARLSLSGGAP